MAAYRRVVTCGMTAYTPGSAPDPRLGNEYGKPLPFYTIPDSGLNFNIHANNLPRVVTHARPDRESKPNSAVQPPLSHYVTTEA